MTETIKINWTSFKNKYPEEGKRLVIKDTRYPNSIHFYYGEYCNPTKNGGFLALDGGGNIIELYKPEYGIEYLWAYEDDIQFEVHTEKKLAHREFSPGEWMEYKEMEKED